MTTMSEQIDELQADNQTKEDLINEANTAIEDMTDVKHDMAAKLKHLFQVYVMDRDKSID